MAIRGPNGKTEVLQDLPINDLHKVKEGKGSIER